MRFVYVLVAAVVVIGMADCRPELDQEIRALKLKLAKKELEKKELEKKEQEKKQLLTGVINTVTDIVGGLTSTVTDALQNLDLANLGLDDLLGTAFSIIGELVSVPLLLFELLDLKGLCRFAGQLISQLTGVGLVQTVLNVICPVVVNILEDIVEAAANLVGDILNELKGLFVLLKCFTVSGIASIFSALLAELNINLPLLQVSPLSGLCNAIFGDALAQANLVTQLLGDIVNSLNNVLGGILPLR